MLAAQQKNENKALTIFGIVTNGEQWEFARLENSILTRNSIAFSIFDLHPLYTAVDFVFKRCCEQIVKE
jgi:hypothetical protein